MESTDRRILQGHLPLEALRFGLPLALGMALQTSFNLVDAYLIARLPDDEVGAAVGALGICDQLAAIGSIVAYGVSTATASLLSRRRGEGDRHGTASALLHSLWVLGGLGLLFALLGVLGAGFIVRDLLGVGGPIADVAVPTLRVLFAGNVTVFLMLHLTTAARALGSAKTPVALLVLGNVLNLVLSVAFIYGPSGAPPLFAFGNTLAQWLHIPHMGLLGGAYATVLARLLTVLPIAFVLFRRFPELKGAPGQWRELRRDELSRMFQLSWPSSAEFVVRIVAMLVLLSFVARTLSAGGDQSAQTAMGVVFRLDTMVLFVSMGWGNGAQTFVAQNLGAGNAARARKSGLVFAAYAAASMVLFTLWLGPHGEDMVAFFISDRAGSGLGDAAVLQQGMAYLDGVRVAYPLLAFAIVLANALTSAERPRLALAVDGALLLLAFPLVLTVLAFAAPSLHHYALGYAAINALLGGVFYAVYRRAHLHASPAAPR